MEFIAMKDKATEAILGVSVKLADIGCCVNWNYPIKYAEVCIFEVPLSEEFDEQKAISGEYRYYKMKYPDQSYRASKIVNFAMFPVNEKGQLIRQDVVLRNCNITVSYGITTEMEEIPVKGIKKIFSKPELKKHIFLNIKSQIALPGKCILYRMKKINGVFCLPSDLVAGRIHKFELNEPVELFTEEKYITLCQMNMNTVE